MGGWNAPGMASPGAGAGGAGRIVEVHDPAWQDALARVPHDVYHLPGYARVEADVNGATPVAFVHAGERSTFLLPLLLRPVPGSAPRRRDLALRLPRPGQRRPPGRRR